MTTRPATKRRDEVKPRVAYEHRVIAEAEHFTVVQFAPRNCTVRTTASTLEEAEEAARVIAAGSLNQRDVMIYAVSKGSQALVKQLDHRGNWKEPVR
jgi:hypothetical protein